MRFGKQLFKLSLASAKSNISTRKNLPKNPPIQNPLPSVDRLNKSFSKVTYLDIARFVNLDPSLKLDDALLFNLQRSRIPTALFKDIVKDIDILRTQYGPIERHGTEEARVHFFAPIFNRIVSQFNGLIMNEPESMIEGRISRRGRIEYYLKSFGAIAVVLVEMKLRFKTINSRMKAVAQVVAECDACDWNNTKIHGSSMIIPVYGILSDGITFQFFKFTPRALDNGKTSKSPSNYYTGTFSIGIPSHASGAIIRLPSLRKPEHDPPGILCLADFSVTKLAKPRSDRDHATLALHFIKSLRPICEIVFNLLLLTYTTSLKGYQQTRSITWNSKDHDGPLWDEALRFAGEALEKSQGAEALRQDNSVVDADRTANEALKALTLSINSVPAAIRNDFVFSPLMDGWKDDGVANA